MTIRMDAQGGHVTAVNVVSIRSPLSALLVRPPVSAPADATLADALATMEEAGVSALLVEPGTGLITEGDIARALGHGAAPTSTSIEDVATPPPVVVPGSMPILEACAVMLNEQLRYLVVEVDGGLGIVSLRDLAAVLLQTADPHIWLASLRVAIDLPSEIWLG